MERCVKIIYETRHKTKDNINGIVSIVLTVPYFLYIGRDNMETYAIIFFIGETVLALGIGIISFFLKRTIDELDHCKSDIARIKEDYITKEDFFREQGKTDRKLDRIMDILLEIKGGK